MGPGSNVEGPFVTAMPEGTVDPRKWWRSKNLRTLNLLLAFPMLSIFTQGFDGSMMNGLQSVENWRNYFGEPKGSTLGLFNAAYPIGAHGTFPLLLISLCCSNSLACGATLCIIGSVVQASAQNLVMFVIARGILGCGTVFLGASGAPLITEIAHPAHRATATALFNTSYSLGAIVAAWTTFASFRIDSTWSWRIPSAIQGLPSIIQLLGLYSVPESPRWLSTATWGCTSPRFFLTASACVVQPVSSCSPHASPLFQPTLFPLVLTEWHGSFIPSSFLGFLSRLLSCGLFTSRPKALSWKKLLSSLMGLLWMCGQYTLHIWTNEASNEAIRLVLTVGW
ncbi:hypothetical protein BDP81DRAFT_384039 [Colletotrichum phormii]|uniref:Major facilitator superfamily (MFS) profile domain-containing protein n=1 Tax=Colletotrichum phormii TaxID=359342 RepID=A0AAI9ZGI2_9PEZI|nr:uncharacterized protein BDP81DRAFT_384039 [Colletotrichum phormii]KAK1623788.1 hypothetical protein BDP81DRAFT_384039 [Colletotrichum phormii]